MAASLLLDVLPGQPASENFDDVIYLLLCKLPAFRDAMPFGQTTPAAGPGCVLSDKNRMVPHWCLFAVIDGLSISQSLGYKVAGMLEDHIQSLASEIFGFFTGEPKPAAKLRPPQ